MDTFGAVLGPSFALLYLYYHPGGYVSLFYIAFIPGLIAVASSALLKEKKHSISKTPESKFSTFSFMHYWKDSPLLYKKICTALLVFALFNSADIFLLMKIKEAGVSDLKVIAVYIFYNLVYALAAYPIGKLSDEVGFKKVMINGLVLFAIVYAGFAFSKNVLLHYILSFLYGIYAASTEGVAKAWITNSVKMSDTATAVGTFTAFQSICALFASSITGFIWWQYGSVAALTTTAAGAILALFLLLRIGNKTGS